MCINNSTKQILGVFDMKFDPQIHYWAHMLDESLHASYYDVYMQEHPEDKLPNLIDSLLGEFADDMKKDHIKIEDCLVNGIVNDDKVEEFQKKIKHKYHWELIPAKTYTAIISRMIALSDRAKGQRLAEDNEISYDDVSHMVSRRTIERCLNIICHNTNVLEANNFMLLDTYQGSKVYGKYFKKHDIPALTRYVPWYKTYNEDYFAASQLYKAWGAYAKGNAGEPYVCDSDNGLKPLKEILDSIDYSADDIDLVVTLNKALDVVHFRSDLAAAFIEGGQKTCALVSNLPDKFVI